MKKAEWKQNWKMVLEESSVDALHNQNDKEVDTRAY